jgi:UDPglucose 6-dehydrogenase
MAKICVTGIWHQGAVVSACLADMGNEVCGVCDPKTAASLNVGKSPVYEPELAEIITANIGAGRLRYTADYAEGLPGAEFAFICTDTPVNLQDDSDLSPIYQIAENIGRCLTNDIILCITAQVPVGTSENLARLVRSLAPDHDCRVAYIPEFLRLGIAVETFRRADRVVIGCNDFKAAEKVAQLYQPLHCPIVHTDIHSAEMAKHGANAFLSMSISFINEIANLCEKLGADALEVARILKLDKRIGPHAFLSPGLGFAGGTLGREIRALQKFGTRYQTPTPLLDAVWQVNANRYQIVGERLTMGLGSLVNKQIGILGLTYKAGTSTMRRAISLDIIRDLAGQGAKVLAYDPLANLEEVQDLPPFLRIDDPYEAAKDTSALVLVTEWSDLGSLDFPQLLAQMQGNLFLDTRNILDPAKMAGAGFRYLGIGRSFKGN